MDCCKKQVKADCEELLSRFQKTDSVRFETFSQIWREMKFSEIFYGTVKRKNRAFTRLILDTAYCFFLPPFSFQIRVGGLYLLYSLHGCQTAAPPEQIHLAVKDWEHVKKFEKDASEAQHLDVVYILQKMLSCKAFYFTAMPTTLCFKKRRKAERSVLCEDFMERASRPQELINMDLLEELSNIHELYEKMKTSVDTSSEQPGSSISLIRKNLVPKLRNSVVDFYNWQQRKDVTHDDGDEDGGEGTSSQQECSKRADLLASIKSKAYGQASEATKSRRHRQVMVDVATNKAGDPQPSGPSRAVKLSLKARTIMNVHISGDMWKEASSVTYIKKLTTLDFVPNVEPRTQKDIQEETEPTSETKPTSELSFS